MGGSDVCTASVVILPLVSNRLTREPDLLHAVAMTTGRLVEIIPEILIFTSLLAAACLFVVYVLVHIRTTFGQSFIKRHGWSVTILLAIILSAVGGTAGKFIGKLIADVLESIGR